MKNFKNSKLTKDQQAIVTGQGAPAWGDLKGKNRKGGRRVHDADFFADKGQGKQPWVIADITKSEWIAGKKAQHDDTEE